MFDDQDHCNLPDFVRVLDHNMQMIPVKVTGVNAVGLMGGWANSGNIEWQFVPWTQIAKIYLSEHAETLWRMEAAKPGC